MYFILKLIVLLEIYAGIHIASEAYVLQTTQQDNNNDFYENDLNELGFANPSMHIDNMVRPAEIREPLNLQEIINYVGADKLSNTAVMSEPQENQQTLTYSELTKLLAFWQLAKEQNYYEMQTGQPDTNHNFVTVD